MTLPALAVPFLLLAALLHALGLSRVPSARRRANLVGTGIAAGAIIVLTIVFDNVMIGSALFDYDHAALLGVYLGAAPVEDLVYAVTALLAVTGVWNLTHRRTEADV
ncbi:lycopene cyclase domain-containing protein [Microbacterium gorillae]|uniref:lycopene cyclase domain-containing protein n=1 Tax=Microbacterium gorillae TaxID=1231063 RepID=UPI00058E11E9|nr:lycopene cyclase domain-containing protein [Microbacterium gorillae]